MRSLDAKRKHEFRDFFLGGEDALFDVFEDHCEEDESLLEGRATYINVHTKTLLALILGDTHGAPFKGWLEGIKSEIRWIDSILNNPPPDNDGLGYALHCCECYLLPLHHYDDHEIKAGWEDYADRGLEDGPEWARWVSYAMTWRAKPEDEVWAAFQSEVKKYEHQLKYEVIDLIKEKCPRNSIELAYLEGLWEAALDFFEFGSVQLSLGDEDLISETGIQERIDQQLNEHRKKGTEATKQNKNMRKEAFCEIYREEQKEHAALHTKQGLLESALERYNAQNPTITERTAWSYVRVLK